MSEVRFTNFARTTVADTTLSAAATSVTLTAVTGLPVLSTGNWTYFVLTRLSDNATEIVKATAIDTGTKIATIVRAQGGTTAKTFSLGDRVENWFTAETLNDLRSQWESDIQSALTQSITRGSVVVGGALNAPTELVGKTSGQVLMGDGTDIKSLPISGDATLAGTGALTIAANAVTTGKILANNVTLAKLVAATAQGKLLGRATASSGNWEEVAPDGVGLELPAGGTLQLKDGGVATAKLADEAVTSAKMNSTVLKYAEVTIPYADVRNLYTVPYTIIAAPAAGVITVVQNMVIILDYGGVAYNDVALFLRYQDATGPNISGSVGGLNAGLDYIWASQPLSGNLAWSTYTGAGKAVVLHTSGTVGSSGTSPLRVKIWYSQIQTDL